MYGTTTIPFSQTMVETDTMPSSKALNLTANTFSALGIMVIDILALTTAWLSFGPIAAGKSRREKRKTTDKKQRGLPGVANPPITWGQCGAELPHAANFCNKCGARWLTEQTDERTKVY